MLQRFTRIYTGATVLILGLSAGAMWAEAVVMVNFWQAISPAEFIAWYREHHAILVGFYSPVQITATLCVLGAPLLTRITDGRWNVCWLAAAASGLAVIALFFVYFKSANAAFLSDAPDLATRIPELLNSWSAWQWFRTAIGAAATVFGIYALSEAKRGSEVKPGETR